MKGQLKRPAQMCKYLNNRMELFLEEATEALINPFRDDLKLAAQLASLLATGKMIENIRISSVLFNSPKELNKWLPFNDMFCDMLARLGAAQEQFENKRKRTVCGMIPDDAFSVFKRAQELNIIPPAPIPTAVPADSPCLDPFDTGGYPIYLAGMSQDKKIQLIKEVRAITGWGLKESKDAVEAADSNEPVFLRAYNDLNSAQNARRNLILAGGKVLTTFSAH